MLFDRDRGSPGDMPLVIPLFMGCAGAVGVIRAPTNLGAGLALLVVWWAIAMWHGTLRYRRQQRSYQLQAMESAYEPVELADWRERQRPQDSPGRDGDERAAYSG